MKKDSPSYFDRINPQLCINAKLRRLHRLIDSAYQQKINPFGLRGSMLSLMFIVGKRPGVSQKEVAYRLVLDQSTVSRDIKKLTDRGLIQRERGTDLRQTELSLTKAGYQLLEEVSPVWELLHQKVEAILGQFNIQQIDAIAQTIHEHLIEIQQ